MFDFYPEKTEGELLQSRSNLLSSAGSLILGGACFYAERSGHTHPWVTIAAFCLSCMLIVVSLPLYFRGKRLMSGALTHG